MILSFLKRDWSLDDLEELEFCTVWPAYYSL